MSDTKPNEVPLTQWETLTLDQASEFDALIRKLIPDYPRMVEALVAAIPFDSAASMQIMDLGCGTGTVAQAVLGAFPNARVTCLDLAENMIAMAQVKLADYADVSYVVADFSSFAFDTKYDVVISSLALHHFVTDRDKQQFYRRVYDCLNPGGVFYNADVVLGANEFLQAVNMRQWRAFMKQHISQEEIENKWIPKYYLEDHPAPLVDQLVWLKEIGFTDVDVLWKYYNFAVYGGVKR